MVATTSRIYGLLLIALLSVGTAAALDVADGWPKDSAYTFACEGEADAYDWTFGDGDSLTGISEQRVYHEYDEDGQYTVTCTPGEQEQETLSITVGEEQAVTDPSSDAISIVEQHGERVILRCDLPAEGGYEWYFGDGTARVDGQTVTHVYGEPGAYDVSCVGQAADPETAVRTISVTSDGRDCYENIEVAPVDCSGTIIEDHTTSIERGEYSTHRRIVCQEDGETVTVDAYEKGRQNQERTYELFAKNTTAPIEVCVGDVCVNPNIDAYAIGERIQTCRDAIGFSADLEMTDQPAPRTATLRCSTDDFEPTSMTIDYMPFTGETFTDIQQDGETWFVETTHTYEAASTYEASCTATDGTRTAAGQETVEVAAGGTGQTPDNASIIFFEDAEQGTPDSQGWTVQGFRPLVGFTPSAAYSGDNSLVVNDATATHRIPNASYPITLEAWVRSANGGSIGLTDTDKGCGDLRISEQTVTYRDPLCDVQNTINRTGDRDWHHLRITYASATSVEAEMDGTTVFEGEIPETRPDAVILQTGFDGFLLADEIRVTGTAQGSPIPSLDTGLVAYYPGENNLLDVVGGHNAIEDVGTVGFTDGLIGDAMQFTESAGTEDQVLARIPQLYLESHASFALWASFDDDYGAALDWGERIDLIRLPDGRVAARSVGDWGAFHHFGTAITEEPVPAGEWHHYTITTGNGGLKLYLDGQLQDRDGDGEPGLEFLRWGAGQEGLGIDDREGMDGAIDELGVWERTLTDREASLLFNDGAGNGYPFGSTSLPVHDICYADAHLAPVTCDGQIVEDEIRADSCRYVTCEATNGTTVAKACNKPTHFRPEYFDVYAIERTGTTPDVCFGDTCVGTFGAQRSPFLPICE